MLVGCAVTFFKAVFKVYWVWLVDMEVLRVYGEEGHTVLKKRILKHLGVGRGGLIAAYLLEDGSVLLKPVVKEELLARLKKPDEEDEVLGERTKIRYDVA